MPKLTKVPFQILVALDQLINTLLGGWADETLSARCWRKRANKHWNKARCIIDALFFWQKDHCKTAYESEQQRLHLPLSLREVPPK
ncbi:pseudouridine synthase [Desulfovibrio sp. OttesenSCG-928-I05]|nr:pseudouridine synthase [Desulfovibrio sp. OttesenSCG-928-I05]